MGADRSIGPLYPRNVVTDIVSEIHNNGREGSGGSVTKVSDQAFNRVIQLIVPVESLQLSKPSTHPVRGKGRGDDVSPNSIWASERSRETMNSLLEVFLQSTSSKSHFQVHHNGLAKEVEVCRVRM